MNEETFLLDKIKHASGVTSIIDAVKSIIIVYRNNLIDKAARNMLIEAAYKRYLIVAISKYRNADTFINIIQDNIMSELSPNSIVVFCIENIYTYRCLAIEGYNDTTETKYTIWFKTVSEAYKYLNNFLSVNPTADRNTLEIVDLTFDKQLITMSRYADKYGTGYKVSY